jgi:hypothetical protein
VRTLPNVSSWASQWVSESGIRRTIAHTPCKEAHRSGIDTKAALLCLRVFVCISLSICIWICHTNHSSVFLDWGFCFLAPLFFIVNGPSLSNRTTLLSEKLTQSFCRLDQIQLSSRLDSSTHTHTHSSHILTHVKIYLCASLHLSPLSE